MSIPADPVAMHGWFGYRHIPYPYDSLAYRIARDIVAAKFPKKEFFEVIAMVEAIRTRLDPSAPLFECCSGHGLMGMLLAWDPRIPSVSILDKRFPPNCGRLFEVLVRYRPDLEARVHFVETGVESYQGFGPGNFVAAHACGIATEAVINAAVRHRARFFVMPCCISRQIAHRYGIPDVRGREDEINAKRLQALVPKGYVGEMLRIDSRITPMNTILCGRPEEMPIVSGGGVAEAPLPACLPPKR